MKSAEETTTLQRRLTWVNEHWILFFSEMPLRDKNLQSVTQTLQTKVELHMDPMNLNSDRHSQKGS